MFFSVNDHAPSFTSLSFILSDIVIINMAKGNYYSKGKSYSKGTPCVYSLNLKGGKKYVGKTNNLKQRLSQHFNGRGAKWTQKNKPVSVNHIQKCTSNKNASKAETIVYGKMRDYHGKDKVRGAGNCNSKS